MPRGHNESMKEPITLRGKVRRIMRSKNLSHQEKVQALWKNDTIYLGMAKFIVAFELKEWIEKHS
jgi:hypothetical protein